MGFIAANDDFILVGRENLIDCFDHSTHRIVQICEKDSNENISDVAISSDNKYFGVLTNTSKQLIIYNLPELRKIKNIILPRSASKINFSTNSTQIFIADKTGDVLSYNVLDDNSGIKLLGHLSLLLNVFQTRDGKYLITSDRDEKIKVSNYPNTYSIQTYCLGHKEFVHYIELLIHNDNVLCSASGDGTIKFWDYITGLLHYTIDVNSDIEDKNLIEDFRKCMAQDDLEVNSLPIIHIAQTYLNELCSLFAVTVHSVNKIFLYSLKTEDYNFTHRLETCVTLDNFPTALKFHKNVLYVYDDVNSKLIKYEVSFEKNVINVQKVDKIQLFENKIVSILDKDNIESIKVLFKRKFDNVQEYQERKKQRLAKPV